MTTSFSMPVRCSFISFLICGSTFAVSRTSTCVGKRSTILKTAGEQLMRSSSMRCAIQEGSKATANTSGNYSERRSGTCQAPIQGPHCAVL